MKNFILFLSFILLSVGMKAQNDELSEGFLDRLRECFGDDALNDA
jgi:hypothetical protein